METGSEDMVLASSGSGLTGDSLLWTWWLTDTVLFLDFVHRVMKKKHNVSETSSASIFMQRNI